MFMAVGKLGIFSDYLCTVSGFGWDHDRFSHLYKQIVAIGANKTMFHSESRIISAYFLTVAGNEAHSGTIAGQAPVWTAAGSKAPVGHSPQGDGW